MDKVKIGFIGVGQIAKMHMTRYEKLPVEIVAAADINEQELKRVAAERNIKHTFTDYKKLLEMDEIVAVDVCLHNNLHAPVTIAALKAGKNVYCEKPIAGSWVDGKAMVDTAKKEKRLFSIQLSTVFSLESKATKRLIEGGYLGDLYYAKSYGHRRRGRPYVDGYGTSSFVQKDIAQGGAMFDMGVYHIAQMLYLMGNPKLETITGAAHQHIDMYKDRRENGKYSVEELGIGWARMAGGISFVIEESWAIHSGGQESSHLYGSKGGVKLNPFTFYTTIGDMEMDGTFDLRSADSRWHSCFANTDSYDSPQAHWVAANQGRVELIDTAGLALNTMFISDGIYLSSKLGKEVTAAEIEQNSKSTALKV